MRLNVFKFSGAARFQADIEKLQRQNEVEILNLLEIVRHIADDVDLLLTSCYHEVSEFFSFDLTTEQDAAAAAAAVILDSRLNDARVELINSNQVLSEQELFFNYFSHVAAILQRVFTKKKDKSDLYEMQIELRELIRKKRCAPLMAYLSWNYARSSGVFSDGSSSENYWCISVAMDLLKDISSKFQFSQADLISLVGCIAIAEMGGPKVAWRPGRCDGEQNKTYVDQEDAFSLQENVVLSWLQSIDSEARGCCFMVTEAKSNLSGRGEPRSQIPSFSKMSKGYFVQNILISEKSKNTLVGFLFDDEYAERCSEIEVRQWVELYASDEERFIQDFCAAFTRLQEYRFNFQCFNKSFHPHAGVINSSKLANNADLEHFSLPGDLAIFGFDYAEKEGNSSKSWRKIVVERSDELLEQIRKLTRTSSGKPNLKVFRVAHRDTPSDFSFCLKNPNNMKAAKAAGEIDRNLTQFKPSMVSREVSEEEFYSNYFSHVLAIRKSCIAEDECKLVKVIIGSCNPVKIKATRKGFIAAFKGQNHRFKFISLNAPSGVSNQPMDDEETLKGATNRAKYCQVVTAPRGRHTNIQTYYVGIEGGISDTKNTVNGKSELKCFAWIVILTNHDSESNAVRTATFTLPNSLSLLVRKGMELGSADDAIHQTKNSKQRGGTVGKLSNGVIDRTEFYKHAVVLALAPTANPALHV